MLPLMQNPSFLLLTWKAVTGGWWDTCRQRQLWTGPGGDPGQPGGFLGVPGRGRESQGLGADSNP